MASLFGATTADTPQFERTEVAEETSPLMGAKSEHIRSGKLHIAMPVVGNRGLGVAPAAAERSGSADTISYGNSPEPARKLSGLLEEAADLGRNFLVNEARRSRSPVAASQSSSRSQPTRSARRTMEQLGLEVGASMA